jgi:hypothetical protein
MADKPKGARHEIAEYLRAQTPTVNSVAEGQKQWVGHVQSLFDMARSGNAQAASVRARALGVQFGDHFRKCLEAANKVHPPAPAGRCQEYFQRWISCLIRSADALAHAPEDGKDTSYLRDCHDFVEDARYAVKPLTEIRQRLYLAATGQDPSGAIGGAATPPAAAPTAAKPAVRPPSPKVPPRKI